jgi:hypothetical protein
MEQRDTDFDAESTTTGTSLYNTTYEYELKIHF